MLLITLVVVAAMAAGAFARNHTHRSDEFVRVALDLVMLLMIPVIGYTYATRLELNVSTVVGILGGYAVIAIVGVIAWQVTDKRMHLSRAQQGAVVLGAVLANTGYLGLPVARTLLAEHEFPQSVAWDSLISQPMALLIAPFIAAAFSPTHQHAHVGKQLLAALVHDPSLISRAMIEETLRYKRLDGVPAALDTIARAWFPGGRQAVDLRPSLAGLAMPAQLVWGRDDRIIPVAHAEALSGAMPVHILDAVGHIPQMEKAGEVNRLIAGFVEANR